MAAVRTLKLCVVHACFNAGGAVRQRTSALVEEVQGQERRDQTPSTGFKDYLEKLCKPDSPRVHDSLERMLDALSQVDATRTPLPIAGAQMDGNWADVTCGARMLSQRGDLGTTEWAAILGDTPDSQRLGPADRLEDSLRKLVSALQSFKPDGTEELLHLTFLLKLNAMYNKDVSAEPDRRAILSQVYDGVKRDAILWQADHDGAAEFAKLTKPEAFRASVIHECQKPDVQRLVAAGSYDVKGLCHVEDVLAFSEEGKKEKKDKKTRLTFRKKEKAAVEKAAVAECVAWFRGINAFEAFAMLLEQVAWGLATGSDHPFPCEGGVWLKDKLTQHLQDFGNADLSKMFVRKDSKRRNIQNEGIVPQGDDAMEFDKFQKQFMNLRMRQQIEKGSIRSGRKRPLIGLPSAQAAAPL